MGKFLMIRCLLQKLLGKNEVIYSYFETKSNPFSIFTKPSTEKKSNISFSRFFKYVKHDPVCHNFWYNLAEPGTGVESNTKFEAH